MKKVFSIILLLMIIFTSSNTATALQPLNYTNIFPQGQYLVSEKNGKLKPGKYEFSLITPNVVSYVYIIDKNNIERFSKRFNSEEVECFFIDSRKFTRRRYYNYLWKRRNVF